MVTKLNLGDNDCCYNPFQPVQIISAFLVLFKAQPCNAVSELDSGKLEPSLKFCSMFKNGNFWKLDVWK